METRTERESRGHMFGLVAHDLANNLAAAKMCIAGLSAHGRGPGDRSADYMGVLRQTFQQMEQLIADLRDTQQMMSGRFVIEPGVSVSPAALVSTAIDDARARLSDRRLVAACAPALPSVRADERRVQRVFTNLLENAAKFTGQGGVITLGAERGPSPGQVVFFVRDDGVGISEADQARIFEPYWQADPRRGGSGLGLTVCRGIVEAHGGRITVTSRRGAGSTFAFTLPCAGERADAPDVVSASV